MTRHSQHANDRSFYSHHERKDAGYGYTKKDVLGTDCFLPFGYCALSLVPPKNPVATPDGYIYDREFLLENLLSQKLTLQEKAKKYELQERKKARQELNDKRRAELKAIEDFQKTDQGLISEDARHTRKRESAGGDERPEKRLRQGELLVVDKEKHREKSFWAPETTPSAAPTEVQKVDTTTKCPMSGKKLRIKDLIEVKFDVLDEDTRRTGGGRGVFCCALTKHALTCQQAVLIKPSGQVVLESVLEDCVYKEMKCPITGIKLKSRDDVMKLQQGGTGFSAHNQVEVGGFTGIRSRGDDDRRNQGHLPKAGYVGLV